MLRAIVVMSSVLAASPALAQDWMAPNATPKTELLWPGAVPGAVGTEDVDKPTLTIYLPSKGQATGAGIVICPGGGYRNLAMDHEGCFPGIIVRHGTQKKGPVGPAVRAGVAGAGERYELPLGVGEKDAFAAPAQVGTEGHLAAAVDLAGLEVEGEGDTVVPAADGRCVPAQFGERLKRIAGAK